MRIGIVLLTLGLGFLLLSPVVGLEGRALWFFKLVPTALGTGFLLAGAVSYVLSQRLGLIQTPDTHA